MRLIKLLAPSLLASVCAFAQAAPLYTLRTIAPLGFPNALVLTGINNQGVVLGNEWREETRASTGFVDRGGARTWLDTLMFGSGINDAGTVAGTAGDIVTVGYVVDGAGAVMLPSMQPQGSVSVAALNHQGHAVGSADAVFRPDGSGLQGEGAYDSHAFIYRDGAMNDLGTLGGDTYSSASAVNGTGAVAGYSREFAGGGARRAFLHNGAAMLDLGTLGGAESWANGINDNGAVVGVSDLAGEGRHAFLYVDGAMVDLAPGGGNTEAFDINNAGQVVGRGKGGGFLYANGVMAELDTLIAPGGEWHVTSAVGINDLGQIVGQACNTYGECVGALLSPVPEPASTAMLLGGLAVLGVAARRRKGGVRRVTG
ncbi:VPLPA-CTERM sorting domain-containing protein [Pseudoduganella sp. LjRoot289]|uniref:PEP-CTERM sorting domain-containing protein n=1 Tax=Pseudoduganella sp. LjRoot289 TaxID=3342314 RepID=UPI003ED06722